MSDVIVVGAGGCGPVVAKELAERCIEVTVLEAGGRPDPDRAFSRLEDDMGSIVDGVLRWGPADRSLAPWVRRRDGIGIILQVAGVGGTTLHYNAISPRAYPSSFAEEWPFPYEELLGCYEQVEAFLPVTMVADLATKDELFARGCARIGLARSETRDVTEAVWRPAHNAILPIAAMRDGIPARYPHVDGCTMCGHCLQGCSMPLGAPLERKAKRATNVSYVPAAEASGNCRIETDSFATAVLFEPGTDGRARARGVRWRDAATGESREAEARAVVLACGAIESPRLWLNSGLPDGGSVGRYFTMHDQDFVTGFFDHEVHPNVGQVTMARADFPGYGTLWSQGFGPQAFAAAVAGIGRGTWGDRSDGPWDFSGRAWGTAAVKRLSAYSRSLTVVVSTDDETHPDNRVTLAGDWPADEHGAVPLVVYRPTTRTTERREWLARKATEILRAAGAREVHRTNPLGFTTHLMSTMRIGTDPTTSVFDPDGEAHAVERLWIADTSALPNGLGGPNPTLTAQALATRTASRIAARLGA